MSAPWPGRLSGSAVEQLARLEEQPPAWRASCRDCRSSRTAAAGRGRSAPWWHRASSRRGSGSPGARCARLRTGPSCWRRAPRAPPSAGRCRAPRSGRSPSGRASARSCRARTGGAPSARRPFSVARLAGGCAGTGFTDASPLQDFLRVTVHFHLAPLAAAARPLASIRNVLRSMPMYFLPYRLFSWMTSNSLQTFSSVVGEQREGQLLLGRELLVRGHADRARCRRSAVPALANCAVQVAEVLAFVRAARRSCPSGRNRSRASCPRRPSGSTCRRPSWAGRSRELWLQS